MRYIANSSGYLQEVSFGAEITCNGQSCTEYTGAVPDGYTSLAAWAVAECERLHKWKVEDGNLVEDASAPDPEENQEVWVGDGVNLRTTSDGRGNLRLYKSDGTLAVSIYANASSGGEVDVYDAGGTRKAALYVTSGGVGHLRLYNANGTAYTLTPELIQKLINS